MDGDPHSSRTTTSSLERTARVGLGKVIPRRKRVTWGIGVALAIVFALLVTPSITAERWLGSLGLGTVVNNQPAPITVRVPALAGLDLADKHVSGGGVVIVRGQVATGEDAAIAEAILAATPRGPLPYIAFFVLALVFGIIFTHHMRRSTLGRLVRVQVVSLISIALLAAAVKFVLLGTAASVLVVPVALLAIVPTMVLDRVVGLATGVLAALVVALLGPFDLGVAILMLVQASTAGLVVAERPRHRWKSALFAGAVTTLFTAATYVLLTYLTTGAIPPVGDPLKSTWFLVAIGPAVAMFLATPLVPLYQLLVGEITQAKLVELEDLSNPLLRQIAERSPGTWQHSLAMANMAEIAANSIGANGRLVRVGAYYHDLGKSLTPKYFIENLESGETSPHDRLPPEVSCDAIFAHVTEGIVTARKAGLHERIVDFMHMHHGNGVLEYFWGKTREQGNPNNFTIEDFRYPGHPPQSRETAILAICDAVEAASRTLKKPNAASIESLVQRIVYGKLHLGQLDESGLSMSDLRRISDSLRETIRHANHGRIEYPWQKAEQDASASSVAAPPPSNETSQILRLDSLDRRPVRATGMPNAQPTPSMSMPIELGPADRKSGDLGSSGDSKEAISETTDLRRPSEDIATIETAPAVGTAPRTSAPPVEPGSASRAGTWEQSGATVVGPAAGVQPSLSTLGPRPQRASLDDDFAREASRDPFDELPEGARAKASSKPPGLAPDVIGPSTFTGPPPTGPSRPSNDTGARKRAATLSPVPRTSSPTIPPAGLLSTPARPGAEPATIPDEPARTGLAASSGLATGSVHNQTLLGGPIDPALRRRAPTVPSDPPITRLAERAATDPAAWSSTPAEPLRRSNEAPAQRTEGSVATLRPEQPKRPSEPAKRQSDPPYPTLRPDEPPYAAREPTRPSEPKREPATRPNGPATRPGDSPQKYTTRDTLPTDPKPRTLADFGKPTEPARPSVPALTMRGPSAPVRLPAGPESPPRFPAEPSISADASAPNLRPGSPTATPTRMAGPPLVSTELDSATTNPPPLRRGGGPSPGFLGLRDVKRLPGILLEQEALDHDAKIQRNLTPRSELTDDDVRVTAPHMPVQMPPTTLVGHVASAAIDDAGRTEPSLPRVELPLRAPPTDPPAMRGQAQDGSWAAGLATRVDAAIDEWGIETPVVAPSKAELRALLGVPDPTRQQSIAEIERLHEAARDLQSDPEILPPRPLSRTFEVNPDDIEASIEIAPRARTRSPSAIGTVKKKPPGR